MCQKIARKLPAATFELDTLFSATQVHSVTKTDKKAQYPLGLNTWV